MKKLILASALIAATGASHAGLSATGGYVTDYVFRGSLLGDASAYGSVDYEQSGFYAGIWGIQYELDAANAVDDIEYDLYAGYGFDVNDSVSLGLGYTQYNYENDDTFQSEVNVFGTFGPVDVSLNFGNDDVSDEDYAYYSIGYSYEWFGITYGLTDNDDDAAADPFHVDLTASGEVSGVDVTFLVGAQDADDDATENNTYFVLDVSKSFEF